MYLIIIGAGDTGTPLIDIATGFRDEVVVIEHDDERASRAADRFDCLVLHDDATTKETLSDAGAGQADAIISTTEKDATNIMVSLLAEEFDIPAILSVVHDPEHMALFERIGVNTMENPEQLVAERLYRTVARPSIADYMSVGEDAAIFEIRVTEDAPIAGKTLKQAAEETAFSAEMVVVVIERGGVETPIAPRGDTIIQAGDRLTVYSGVGADSDVTAVFGYDERE
jgi:trk system potassium uptake protein TrkA